VLKSIDHRDYAAFADYLESVSGIALGPGKEYLLDMRLRPLLQSMKIDSMQQLISRAKAERRVQNQIISALTTNETSWFRDRYPFEQLQNLIFPQLVKSGSSSISFWSAACSSGQEPYSVAMAFAEARQRLSRLAGIRILATEISDVMLEEARKGWYTSRSISRGLSEPLKKRYLQSCDNGWQIVPEIREQVQFRKFNLVHGTELQTLGRFDIIFCRNVLIYFTAEVKAIVLARLATVLKPGGYLVLGASEYLPKDQSFFIPEKLPLGFVFRRADSG